jgi:5-formyltetrahydrofolate cyclo-ligase
MNANKNGSKTELRSKIREVLKSLPPEKRESDSETIRGKLKAQSFFQNAIAILFFAPLLNEADVWPLLEEVLAGGRIAALPSFDQDNRLYISRRVKNLRAEIVSGRFGIREPDSSCVEIAPDRLDLALVPGVAFDWHGNRLGRGKGFYDRLLQRFPGKKVAVAFDEQMVKEVPVEKTDVKMDFILTPTRCVSCGT